jgi:hypothetical protein
MKFMRLCALACLLLGSGAGASACSFTPGHGRQANFAAAAELVAEADAIVLAVAQDAEVVELYALRRARSPRTMEREARYRFRVEEWLKGRTSEVFDLIFPAPFRAAGTAPDQDFDEHRAPDFAAGATRASLGPTCEIWADFRIGARYLIFIGHDRLAGFEQIIAADDRWLSEIRRLTRGERR